MNTRIRPLPDTIRQTLSTNAGTWARKYIEPLTVLSYLGESKPSRVLAAIVEPHTLPYALAEQGHMVDVAAASAEAERYFRALTTQTSINGNIKIHSTMIGHYCDSMAVDSVDAAIDFDSLRYLLLAAERLDACSQITRVLRPGGFVFTEFTPRPWLAAAALQRRRWPMLSDPEALYAFWESGVANLGSNGGTHLLYAPTVDEVRELFESVGIRHVEAVGLDGLASFIPDKEWDKLEHGADHDRDLLYAIMIAASPDAHALSMSGTVMYVGQNV